MMKRVNSNTWKGIFDGDSRISDSAYLGSSQGKFNAQNLELSQVKTQDLFGQSSQNELSSSQKPISMFDSWKFRRYQQNSAPNSATMSMTTPNRNELASHSKTKMMQHGNDVLDLVQSNFQDNRNEMKSLGIILKETLESVGGTLNIETKAVLSSFMEELSKNYDVLSSQLQEFQKCASVGKELEKQLASKNCQISSLETTLKVMEEESSKTKEDKCDCNGVELKEDLQSLKKLIVNKLEEIGKDLASQKETTNEFSKKVLDLKDDCVGLKTHIQTCVKESESRILKETKRLPHDLKNAVNIKSDLISIMEGIPAELEYSLKSSLELWSKEFKSELTKEQKKNLEQHLRKSFDHISHKMDSLITDNKKIHQFVQSKIHDPFRANFRDIEGSIKYLKNKSSTDSTAITDLHQRIRDFKDDHSHQLQSILTQQKDLANRFDHLSNINETKKCITQSVQIQTSPLIVDKSKQNPPYANLANNFSPNSYIHNVDNKVNNISMPVINQTNIYPSHVQQRQFESRYACVLNDRNYIQSNQNPIPISDKGSTQKKFLSPFIPQSVVSYRPKPSPIVAVRPQMRICNDTHDMKMNMTNQKENLTQFKKPFSSNHIQNNAHLNQMKPVEDYNTPDDRKTKFKKKNGSSSIRNKRSVEKTPQSVYNLRDIPGSALRRSNVRRKREFPSEEQEENSGYKWKPDASIYDFTDDEASYNIEKIKRKGQGNFEGESTVSSPALTLNLILAKPVRKQTLANEGNTKVSRLSERAESLILDNMFF